MNQSLERQSFVLQLFGLDDLDVQSIEYVRDGNDAIVDIVLTAFYTPCPHCGYDKPRILNYVTKYIVHSELSDRACRIRYHARRYKCPVCGKTYYEPNPFVFKAQKISIKTVYNILEDLKNTNETFASVARRYYISPTTAASIFDHHVNVPRKTLPKCMCIDEVYAFKSKESKYVCVLLDYTTQTPVDLLPSRRLQSLESYFMAIPREERKNVQVICSDMYKTYRTLTKRCLPNAIHAVDHFHVAAEINRKVDDVRIRIMKSMKKKDNNDEYYLLKKYNWMIYRTDDDDYKPTPDGKPGIFDPNRERKFNKHFNRYLNYYEIRDMIWNMNPTLRDAWKLKDESVEFYRKATRETAPAMLNELINMFRSSKIPEMNQVGKTLKEWKKEILNSFTIVGVEYKVDNKTGHVEVKQNHMSNALIENKNHLIKNVKHLSNGYNNWHRFRNRVMYIMDDNISYSMYPQELPKVNKKKKE